MNIFQRLFDQKSGVQVGGGFVLTSETTIQTRRAQTVDAELATAIRGYCESIPYIIACYLLDARKPDTEEIVLIIAVTLDDEAAHLVWVGQQFQAMLQRFPAQAGKTFIKGSGELTDRHAGTEFYVRRAP
jgi:hypothetical protein